MKKIKLLKQIDFWLQVVAIVGGVAAGIILQDETCIFTYFIVGGLQVVSYLLHFFVIKQLLLTKQRVWYERTLLWIVVVLLSSLVYVPIIFVVLCLLLLVSPCFAIWYCTICYKELKLVNHENEQ